MSDELKNLREENDNMIEELSWYKAKANKLERENEFLRQAPELQLTKDSSAQGLPFIEEDNQC